MKYIVIVVLLAVIISCSNHPSIKEPIPSAPVSIKELKEAIVGKSFTTLNIALQSPFTMNKENPYEWMKDMNDTTAFFKKYLSERMKFVLSFPNDSTATLTEDNKSITGNFTIDNEVKEEEKEGFKIRISYPDSSMAFPGASEPMMMTYTYHVAGADASGLFLELPRSFNRRKVLALLKAK